MSTALWPYLRARPGLVAVLFAKMSGALTWGVAELLEVQLANDATFQLAGLDGAEADAAMMAAHTSGRGVVKSFQGGATARELAEAMHAQLAAADLLVEVERM